MKRIDFNKNWYVSRLEEPGSKKPVTIPHDAMISEPRTPLSPGGKNTGWYEAHDYVYEKKFRLPAACAGKKLIFEFEGVYRKAEVWINGEKAAFRPYGYTNFYVDATDLVSPDQVNTIRVIARNSDQPNSRWYSGAGIYRPVHLWMAEQEYIPLNGLKIRTVSLEPAVVEIQLKTVGTGTASFRIMDGDTEVASAEAESDGSASVKLEIPEAKLWDLDTPHLYTCRATFGTDSCESTFGIRTISWGDEGFCLNGHRVILQGACIHHDNGVLGACCYEDSEWRKIRLMKENGYNAVRSAHNPCSKALLDACDRQGVLVMDEYIDHWYIHKTEYDYVEYFMDWWRQDLTDLVDKDYNHPSVVMYSTGNEVSETSQKKGIALTKELTEFLHSLDDTRPVTCGVNIFFNYLCSIGFGIYSDEKAKKEAKQAEKRIKAGAIPKKKRSVGSEFFNDMAGLLGDNTMKLGATFHGCDVKTRDAFANMDIAGYNYGIYRYPGDVKKYPHRLILGSETFCNDAYRFRELAKKHPTIIGDFVWAGMDYLGEVAIGSWEYSDYAPTFDGGAGWVTAGSGRIDLTGRPLGEAYYTRVALEAETGPYIAVCPVNHTGERHSPSSWKMSNAIPSWSWNGCGGRKANVEVYARAAKVRLLVNGRPVGEKQLHRDCIARFSCIYEDGVIEAVSYDAEGNEIGRCSLQTAAEETQLRAVAEEAAVAPGRLCHIRLQYTDENGTIKPLERGILKVQVSGGRLLGLGSACPYNEMSYTDEKTDTYFGEALAVVQADDADRIVLSVTDGRYSAEAYVPVIRG